MENNINNKDKLNDIIENLIISNKDNDYILQRIQYHIENLGNVICHENKKYEERVSRANNLNYELDNFYKIFLTNNQYYYMSNNCNFYEYDGKTYKIVKEDDIHYKLLSTITEEGRLVQWKHKTKLNIIKKIKERSLLYSIPETYTIQNAIKFLLTYVFETKSDVKYFLTLLGDIILKKNGDLLFFVSPHTKKIISLIDATCYITTGISCIHNFISKYHDSHNLKNYRVLRNKINEVSLDIIKDSINKIGIDLIGVACYYSKRYESSENFLFHKSDSSMKKFTLYFYKHSQNEIITEFINDSIIVIDKKDDSKSNSNLEISWKKMHYIWKLFLAEKNIPNIIYSNTLKEILKQKLQYKSDTDVTFLNITSKFLPNIKYFLDFWNDNIMYIKNDFDDEFEIDEIHMLYKNKLKNENENDMSYEDILNIITHFYSSNVDIIDNKYLLNIKCKLWDKSKDIGIFLEFIKSNLNSSEKTDEQLISFEEMYSHYQMFCKNILYKNNSSFIVSKYYFEKYLLYFLGSFVRFDKFIEVLWLTN